MHVGKQRLELGVAIEDEPRFGGRIGNERRDAQPHVGGAADNQFAGRRPPVKVEGEPGLVTGRSSRGGVVLLELDHRTLGQEHSAIGWKWLDVESRGISREEPVDPHPESRLLRRRAGRKLHERELMVHHRRIARLQLHGPDPDVAVDRQGHIGVAVVEQAGSWYLLAWGFDDDIGRAQRPFRNGCRLAIRQGIGPVTARRAGIDPVDQHAQLIAIERTIVPERADRRVGMPGRHAPVGEHLAHHRRPSLHRVVAIHGPRGDAAWRVTGNAFIDEQGRHVASVRNRARRHPGDGAAETDGLWWRSHGPAVDDRLDRVAQVLVPDLLTACPGPEPVVQRAAIGDLPGARVDHDGFAGAADVERAGHELRIVLQDRNPEVQGACFGLQGGAVVLGIGVQHQEHDVALPGLIQPALGEKPVRHVTEALPCPLQQVSVGQRNLASRGHHEIALGNGITVSERIQGRHAVAGHVAADAVDEQDHGTGAGIPRQLVHATVLVQQGKVGNRSR